MDYNEMLVSIGDVRKLLYKILPKNVTTTAIENYVGSLSPIVDVKPVVKGEWVEQDNGGWHCSHCGATDAYAYCDDINHKPTILQDKFCPNCGADMRGDTDA